jgi:type II secretory pathway component PulM
MSPDEFTLVAQLVAGGMPTVAVVAFWKIWNGTSRRIEEIEKTLRRVDRRLLRMEIHSGVDKRDERGEGDDS